MSRLTGFPYSGFAALVGASGPSQTGLQRVVRERPGSAGAIETCFPHTVRVCPAQEILARLHALASTRKASRI